MNRNTPRKKKGQGQGPRRIDGEILDVKAFAGHYGPTEGQVRSHVERGLLPCRRWGGRIIFLRTEVDDFPRRLEGVSVDEAIHNIEVRRQKDS